MASTSSLPPPLPLVAISTASSSTSASQPRRKIFTEQDIPAWLESEAYDYIETLIARLAHAVERKKLEDECVESEAVKGIVRFLREAEAWVDEIPLQTSPQRFGNKAFRDWLAKLEEHDEAFQRTLLSPSQLAVLPELSFQFRSSWGSGARIDYGTGHELSFLAYLLILRLVGVLEAEDEQAMVTRVFAAYMDLVRKLQRVFNLEPAGSKGVWGLDDHQHLVYLWGASQLIGHPTLTPASILKPQSIGPYAPSYLFLSSILHIHTIKRGPFAEHSPLLFEIASTVPSWAKVAHGMHKMYREEVLKKVPVVQHFRFGRVLGWRRKGGNGEEELPSSGAGMDEDARALDEDEGAQEPQSAGTVAPWAMVAHGTNNNNNTTARPPPALPPTRLPASTSLSTMTTTTTAAAGFAHRQHPASFPVPPLSRQTATPPRSFAPPPFFPSRRPGPGPGDSAMAPPYRQRTVADEGGAAAASSPFGVLTSATIGSSSSTTPTTIVGTVGSRDGGGGGDGNDVAGGATGGGGGTKAPWAA
ncbi:hypothetical protein JCM5296_002413 [Sporobolomyces johnsonii]